VIQEVSLHIHLFFFVVQIDGKPMVQKVCEKSYYMLLEIIFCLKGSLAVSFCLLLLFKNI
jgi:hypothetical protein